MSAPRTPSALAEVAREIADWPRWLDILTLTIHCRWLAERRPELCDRYLGRKSIYLILNRHFSEQATSGFAARRAYALREVLALDGLIGYLPYERLACVCHRITRHTFDEKVDDRILRELRPVALPEQWDRETLSDLRKGGGLGAAGKMRRLLADWPAEMSLEEVGEHCRDAWGYQRGVTLRYLQDELPSFNGLCDRLGRFLGPEDWRILRRQLARDGLISYSHPAGRVSVHSFVPANPRWPSMMPFTRRRNRRKWQRQEPRWPDIPAASNPGDSNSTWS